MNLRSWISEAHVVAAGRTGILYHHNTRRAGGHRAEIQYWLTQLGPDALALYWRRFNNRTFFIVHPTKEIELRLRKFVARWTPHFELYAIQSLPPSRHQQSVAVKDGQPSEHK